MADEDKAPEQLGSLAKGARERRIQRSLGRKRIYSAEDISAQMYSEDYPDVETSVDRTPE